MFQECTAFMPDPDYRLSPFRFSPLDDRRYVVTNDVGEHVVLSREHLVAFVQRTLPPDSPTYKALKSRHFMFDRRSRVALDLLALKYRTRAEQLASFTGLHIFVVTLRCDHSCQYCQVSRQVENRTRFDMTREHADRALDLVFQSPSPALKIEFQGGEPLLNFGLIRHVVERALTLNQPLGRDLQFVIATNLSQVSEEMLAFCKQHGIFLSTSLDGPETLHNAQRPVRGGNSHQRTVEGIRQAREALGSEAVSALMTTTRTSLDRVEEIIDEYVRLGFHSIFLRNLSPYGFAVRGKGGQDYDVDRWIAFYQRGLAHILELNAKGYALREEFTTLLLQKLFLPRGSNYVDLQSPAGLGIGALVYNYDGAVYASDEGRMLAEMGDLSFRLGHVASDGHAALLTSETLLAHLSDTMPEGVPMCSDCAFLPLCGADPVFHRATQGDAVGHKAFSAFCKKQMAVLRHLITLLEDDPPARETLLGWL
ncbi:His-Xaa-Ser system radical SAM maturase HxsB [Stigmatella erecta]|uniref:His-Xaa-Ser system radical SAM maturase HxsB n=2 Tax=Stigmatella erecta TaxID=83460 RepID=A0A1I0H3K3_9BACT|nr:His-Xaa-Ser system radical SAM maturase HxsB [Stigmatella erecta]